MSKPQTMVSSEEKILQEYEMISNRKNEQTIYKLFYKTEEKNVCVFAKQYFLNQEEKGCEYSGNGYETVLAENPL